MHQDMDYSNALDLTGISHEVLLMYCLMELQSLEHKSKQALKLIEALERELNDD